MSGGHARTGLSVPGIAENTVAGHGEGWPIPAFLKWEILKKSGWIKQ
jgi:hypothetical protein